MKILNKYNQQQKIDKEYTINLIIYVILQYNYF